jgi:hypothetical protein
VEVCHQDAPVFREITPNHQGDLGHFVACHRADELKLPGIA